MMQMVAALPGQVLYRIPAGHYLARCGPHRRQKWLVGIGPGMERGEGFAIDRDDVGIGGVADLRGQRSRGSQAENRQGSHRLSMTDNISKCPFANLPLFSH